MEKSHNSMITQHLVQDRTMIGRKYTFHRLLSWMHRTMALHLNYERHTMNQTKPELHLFLIWQNARLAQEKIIDDIKTSFEIVRMLDIHWSDTHFSSNLTRFYGQNLPDRSFKEQHCGKGAFLLIVVRDMAPCYEMRETSHGLSCVNVTMFDKKQLYRSWTGGGHRIHATDTVTETDHNLVLLTGFGSEDFCKENMSPFDGTIGTLQRDLTGAAGWESVQQLFYVLNHTVKYVVLRNFEGLPAQYTLASHGDIDLLADSAASLRYILNAQPVFPGTPRVLHFAYVNKEKVLFDFRSVGDGYYDTAWESCMLDNRVFDANGFYRPEAEDYFYSLLYHAFIHKPTVSEDYTVRLSALAKQFDVALNPDDCNRRDYCIEILDRFLSERKYHVSEPADVSVYFNVQDTDVQKISIARICASSKTIGSAIGKILAQTTDKSSDSPELQTSEMCSAKMLRSHFSKERTYPLSLVRYDETTRVVEIGAQTGAITRFLGERCKEVYAIEPQADCADAARIRCDDLDNVEIVAAPELNEAHKGRYDLAILLTEWPKGQPDHLFQIALRKWLEIASQLLTSEGVLLFAVDNRDSVMNTMFAQPPTGLSKKEIEQFLLYAGFGKQNFLYAFPGHGFPQNIFGEDTGKLDSTIMGHWAASTIFTDAQNKEFRSPLIADLFSKLHANGQFGETAPSFIVAAGKTAHPKPDWLIKKWTGFPRQIAFHAETELVSANGVLTVKKTGKPKNDGIFMFTPDITLPLYEGATLETKLSAILSAGDKTGYIAQILEYLAFVKAQCSCKSNDTMELSKDDCLVSGEALDGNFSNIIMTKDGWKFFDLEWQCTCPMPLSLVLFRSLSVHLQSVDKSKLTGCFSLRQGESLVGIMQAIARELNLLAFSDNRTIQHYADFQDRFYSFVFNKPRKKPAFLELFLPFCHEEDPVRREELVQALYREYPDSPEVAQATRRLSYHMSM